MNHKLLRNFRKFFLLSFFFLKKYYFFNLNEYNFNSLKIIIFKLLKNQISIQNFNFFTKYRRNFDFVNIFLGQNFVKNIKKYLIKKLPSMCRQKATDEQYFSSFSLRKKNCKIIRQNFILKSNFPSLSQKALEKKILQFFSCFRIFIPKT